MKSNRESLAVTPVIAAAARRRARHHACPKKGEGARRARKNNYVAEMDISDGQVRGNRPGAGARPSNFNASAIKPRTADLRDFLERHRAFKKRVSSFLAHVKAELKARSP